MEVHQNVNSGLSEWRHRDDLNVLRRTVSDFLRRTYVPQMEKSQPQHPGTDSSLKGTQSQPHGPR